MELHFGKFQMISTASHTLPVQTPSGTAIYAKGSMEYLGAALHGDGGVDHEMSRRIALTTADFDALAIVWTRSALTWKQKVHIFSSLAQSKLLYFLWGCVDKSPRTQAEWIPKSLLEENRGRCTSLRLPSIKCHCAQESSVSISH